ncbi:unnamed protein product [Echinostoma caproni]|uniref:Ig-like domain-containing protein n=1 Tax=Echinostoma caproni TaxID=27848 RepID=A0A183A8W7_9TREM|nr:unnamed protein product [Echinostoma caproni]
MILWYFASTDGSLMQPVGMSSAVMSGMENDSVRFQAIPLEGGRWLEIQLGLLENESVEPVWEKHRRKRTVHTGNQYTNSMLSTAGFGEYFCKVDIPRNWATSNFPEGSQLNLTGPYIPVYLAPNARLFARPTETDGECGMR